MQPNILADLGSILAQLDDAEEVICAAQLQLVIDTLENRIAAREQVARVLHKISPIKGGSSMPFQP